MRACENKEKSIHITAYTQFFIKTTTTTKIKKNHPQPELNLAAAVYNGALHALERREREGGEKGERRERRRERKKG